MKLQQETEILIMKFCGLNENKYLFGNWKRNFKCQTTQLNAQQNVVTTGWERGTL